jgi:drug/metabolite transporter (DMT)-like permease
MAIPHLLVAAAICLESAGKVLYTSLLEDVEVSTFVLLSVGLTALVFMARGRFRMPRAGAGELLWINLSTCVSFACFFFALKHTTPAVVASLDLGGSLLVAVAIAWHSERAALSAARLVACAGIVAGCLMLCIVELRSLPLGMDTTMLGLALAGAALTGATSTFKRCFAWTP